MEQMGGQGQFELPKFSSPEEELKYLRERVAQKEQQHWEDNTPAKKEAIISQEIIQYATASTEARLEEHLIIENPKFEEVLAHLGSLPHREKVRELYRIIAEKGILNAIKFAEAQHNPHIEDDFHRVLVEYVKTGGLVLGLEKERDLLRAIHMTLYEITIAPASGDKDESGATFTEAVGQMERLIIGMLPQTTGNAASRWGNMSFEIAQSNFTTDIVFFVAVQDELKDVFLKQLFSSFPTAKVEDTPADYNVFNEYGVSLGSVAKNAGNFVFPMWDFKESQGDPIEVLLNALTRIKREGEGAAMQFVVSPDTDGISTKIRHAIGQIKQGVSVGIATDIPLSTAGVVAKSFTEFFRTQVQSPKKEEKPSGKQLEFAEKAMAMMEEKIKYPLVRTDVRLVVSAPTHERAEEILTALESAFSQFQRMQGNGIKFIRPSKSDLDTLLHQFTFRMKSDSPPLVLNTYELSTLYHLPISISASEAPQLKAVSATSAPAPADLPAEGTLIGVNTYRGATREIRLTKPDRLRHLYTIGQTGTGKSVFLKSLIMQDILAGHGACFIDPHGSDVQDVLAAIPPERIDDVIYFDPSYTPRPFALNMLEYDIDHPEQKIFVVNEMLAIFKKLYSSSPESMGPAFEQYFRNATMLVMEDPESGNTLLEIPRVLADPAFRNLKLSRCKNPIVVQFWRDIATKTSGESGLQNMIPYITNKFDVFISNDVMRPIIAQEKSSFNFRDIMDNKKILLVNLAKGKLGEMNANLLGLIIIGKFLMAAMSRVDSFGKQLPDFYLYVDEFQNIATPSISAILSEARKYGLSLNLAHQFIGQLPDDIKNAVFGNVGNMAVFRVGAEDAEFLQPQFTPVFQASDIMRIENFNAYTKILINGRPVPPFNIKVIPPPKGNPEILEQMRNLSYLKYGRDRAAVDDAIMKRYMSAQQNQASTAPTPPPVAPPRPVQISSPQVVQVPAQPSPSMPPMFTPSPAQTVQSSMAVSPAPEVSLATEAVSSVTPKSLGGQAQSPFAQAFARATLAQNLPAQDIFATPFPPATPASVTADVLQKMKVEKTPTQS